MELTVDLIPSFGVSWHDSCTYRTITEPPGTVLVPAYPGLLLHMTGRQMLGIIPRRDRFDAINDAAHDPQKNRACR